MAATSFSIAPATTERSRLLDEVAHATDPHRIGEIHDRLNTIDAHGAPARAARILAGLGFDEEAQHRPLDTFSGGWRMRVARLVERGMGTLEYRFRRREGFSLT